MYEVESVFVFDDEELMVVRVDGEENPDYICYPVEVVEKAKAIMANGGTVDCDDDPDYCWVFNDYIEVLGHIFEDEVRYVSECDIKHEECNKMYAEVQRLKAENERLRAEIERLKEDK